MTSSDREPPEITEADLSGARLHRVRMNRSRFRMVDLSGAVLRDVSLEGASIDGEIAGLVVNGVAVEPLVEAELVRRVPARAMIGASSPDELRAAWASLQGSWAETCARVAAMPDGTPELSVEGEWSFSHTLRHLVFVTDGWLGAARGDQRDVHPWGLPFTDIGEFMERPEDLGTDPVAVPSYQEVLGVRAGRVADVEEFLAGVTPDVLAATCRGPLWTGGEELSVLRCLRVLLHEECEHLRYAQRDLDLLGSVG